MLWYATSWAGIKTTGTVSIHDNTVHDIYSDCIHIGGVRTNLSIYANTLYNFGENAIDFKASGESTVTVDVYNNNMSQNDYGEALGSSYYGPVLIAGSTGTLLNPADPDNRYINIRHNYFHDCAFTGISGILPHSKIYENYFKDVFQPIGFEGTDYVEIYNNIFKCTAAVTTSTRLNGSSVTYASAWNVAIKKAVFYYRYALTNSLTYNNTIYCTHADYSYGIVVRGDVSSSGQKIKNNVIHMTQAAGPYCLYYDGVGTEPDVDYNSYYNPNHANRISGTTDANGITTDNGINFPTNFYPDAGGDAVVDAGTTLTLTANGLRSVSTWTPAFAVQTVARAENGGHDIGAYEYESASPPPVGGGGSYYCTLTIQEAQIPGTGNLANFPVLLTAATFQSNCEQCLDSDLANGAIKFYSDVGLTTQLNYEIVDFTQNANPANATAEIWVGIASLNKEANTTIYATWNTNAPGTESAISNNATSVWAAYQATWHLNEAWSVAAGNYKDATVNVNHGQLTDADTDSAQGTGQIGKCIDFAGDADFINAGNSATLEMGTNDWSLSTWFKGGAGNNRFLRKGASTVVGYDFWYYGTDDDLRSYLREDGGTSLFVDSNNTLGADDSAWHHVVVTHDRSGNATFYLDGSAVGTEDISSFVAEDITNNGVNFSIGTSAGAYSATSIDEMRVYSGLLSSDWIVAEFNNHNAPATFVVDGDETGGSPTITAIGTATVAAGVVTFTANRTEAETVVGNPGWYFALQLSEQLGVTATPEPSELRWDSGPLTVSYSDAPYYGHLADVGGTYYLLYDPNLAIGHRAVNPQAYGDGSAAIIVNNAVLEDGDGNALATDFSGLADVDFDGTGTITITVPYPTGTPVEFSSSSTVATYLAAGGYFVPNDFIECTTANSIGTVDLSGSDGTSGNVITIDGGGFSHAGTQTFGDYWVIKNVIHASTVTLGVGSVHSGSIIPTASTLIVPNGATTCYIYNDGIGILDLDGAANVYNTWITTVDPTGLDGAEPVTFTDCYFIESQAAIEAKDVDDVLTFTRCTFEITTADIFTNYAGGDFTLKPGASWRHGGTYTPGYETKLRPGGGVMDDILSIGPYGVLRGSAGM